MKTHLLATIFVALSATAFAQRPSIDETAVRLGVNEWLAVRSAVAGGFDFTKFKALYLPDLEFTDPATGHAADVRGLGAYTARLQPLIEKVQTYAAVAEGDVRVSMNGSAAVTSFTFHSQGSYKDGNPITCGGRVNLTWQRRDGFWQIAREEFTPDVAKAPGDVAIAK
ncbi:MAG: nuclear transport factor 2 family protein [Chthoniobacteraceae bacterium]